MSEDLSVQLQALKNKADMLGVTYHPSIGIEKLKEKVDAKMADLPTEDPVDDGSINGMSPGEYKVHKRKEAGELVRVVITSMDANKKDWPGEIFSVGNGQVGFFKKYVPYGHAWHVPRIILNTIESKRTQIFVPIIDSKGNKTKEPRLVKAYTVDVLPSLTPDELGELAKVQAASGRIEDNTELNS